MAVQTTYFKGDGDALNNRDLGQAFTMRFAIDTATTNVASGDVLKLMEVPANVLVDDVIVNVTTAEGGTLTLDIGDYLIATDVAVDADGYHDGLNGNSAAVTKTSDQLAEDTTAIGYAAGKFYAAATAYIGVLFNNAADAAIFDVIVKGVDCSRPAFTPANTN